MSPTQGQAIFLWGVFLSSHFEKPKGFSVWLATIVRCLTASSLLITPIWCIWHYFVSNPCLMPLASFLCNRGFQYYSILQCPSYVGHYKYPRSIHPNNESGKTGFCQIIFEFCPPKNKGYWSRKGHSVEKTQFLRFFRKSLADKWLRRY